MSHEKPNDDFSIEDILDPYREVVDPTELARSMTLDELSTYDAELHERMDDISSEVKKLLSERKLHQLKSSCTRAAIQIALDRSLE